MSFHTSIVKKLGIDNRTGFGYNEKKKQEIKMEEKLYRITSVSEEDAYKGFEASLVGIVGRIECSKKWKNGWITGKFYPLDEYLTNDILDFLEERSHLLFFKVALEEVIE
jgi:hypothetical protein